MPNHRPEAIANEFLRRAGSNGLTQMQLQKLVYIAHGWTLAIRNEPLVNARLEAWERGPVYPELAKNIAHAGAEPIREKIRKNDNDPFAFLFENDRGELFKTRLNEEESDIIDKIWGHYGKLSGFKLSDLTHQKDTPWHIAYYEDGRNAVIKNSSIKRYYRDLAMKIKNQQA